MVRVLTASPLGWVIGVLWRNRIPCRGVRVNTSVGVTNHIKAELFWGIYESSEIRFVQHYLNPHIDVVELGASLGVVSSHIARRNRGSRFVVVEANPALSEVIASNLATNAPAREVNIVNAAIDYAPGSGHMTRFALGISNLDSRIIQGNSAVHTMVPSLTLSDLLAKYGIKEYVLVCDIEGAEAGILEYDSESLAGCQQIIAELHDTSKEGYQMRVSDLVERLVDLGYSLRARKGPVCVFERV
jgi:FkbM family methyltransferase